MMLCRVCERLLCPVTGRYARADEATVRHLATLHHVQTLVYGTVMGFLCGYLLFVEGLYLSPHVSALGVAAVRRSGCLRCDAAMCVCVCMGCLQEMGLSGVDVSLLELAVVLAVLGCGFTFGSMHCDAGAHTLAQVGARQ